MGSADVRVDRERAFERAGRFRGLAGGVQRVAEIERQPLVARIEGRGSPEMSDGLADFSKREIRAAEVIVGGR